MIPEQDSSRRRRVIDWLEQQFGWRVSRLEPASADASLRRYYRLNPGCDGLPGELQMPGGEVLARAGEGESVILMDAPPPAEDLARFVDVAHRLSGLSLHVPRVHYADGAEGIALVADLGTRTYLDALEAGDAPEPLYEAAIDALVRLQRAGAAGAAAGAAWPAYDTALLRRELSLFPQWYLGRHLGLTPGEIAARGMTAAFGPLIDRALAQPRVLVHRDFHSRNLMLSAPLPGILDFQDAVVGPLTYDLVSLLRDCYVDLPPALEARLLARYAERARAAGLDVPDRQRLLEDFEWMGVQRHLKVLGIFTRLWYRDGRAEYLQYLPRVRRYLTRACARHEALAPLAALIESLGPADEAAVEWIRATRG